MSAPMLKRRAGRPTPEEAEQKRQGLIVTALEEFARVGFHGASLRDIAEKANISSRTLYNYYPDKLALFEACLEFSGREIQPVLPDLDVGLHEGLVRYAIAMQRQLFAAQAMRIAALIYREGGGFDELRQIARIQFERHQVTPVAHILDSHGIVKERCHILATQFVAMAFGEWQRRLLFGEDAMTDEQMADHAELVTAIFLKGIDPWCGPVASHPQI
ncbi:AcrR family transcriptional regulator [Sphingobium sp. OAS761]|uniref:TetR/AcrR family transcriptional regulator n=1 Tax=Sphingobium sp. OAS761 TaxID=2817901 RepID=UPI00209D9319|nr:TetR/AcrR family transcriptional regulator [Sphingobium sp. OAS761]MCP1471476.1 AcrR family transcriptional regulator [Sphingobium sp. OAS761]